MSVCFSRRLLCGAALVGGVCVLVGCGSGSGATGGDASSGAAVAEVPAAAANGEHWPTEEEAKATILKVEYDIWASQTNKDVWHVKDMRHEVHSVKFAQRTTTKQMNYGVGGVTVYPAKILYTRITDYEGKEATREECGADGVWFLYQDSFGDWTGKYGTE